MCGDEWLENELTEALFCLLKSSTTPNTMNWLIQMLANTLFSTFFFTKYRSFEQVYLQEKKRGQKISWCLSSLYYLSTLMTTCQQNLLNVIQFCWRRKIAREKSCYRNKRKKKVLEKTSTVTLLVVRIEGTLQAIRSVSTIDFNNIIVKRVSM